MLWTIRKSVDFQDFEVFDVMQGDAFMCEARSEAAAKEIVRAVNAHDALVEALTLAYAALRDPHTRHLSHDGRGITETIKDALAKAEGKGD